MAIVACAGGEACGAWEPPEVAGGPGAVFVRRGAFVRCADGVESLVDGTLAYFERPGTRERFAHPLGQDECFAFGLPAWFLAELGRSPAELPAEPVYTTAPIDLGHRRLARVAALGVDDFELHERASRLVGALLERAEEPWRRPFSGRPATAAAHRRLAARAREALAADPATGLVELSRQVASSAHHLSRVFGRETGQTLTAYRNRLRVGLALVRLEDGERDLTGLAADLGFADHAHMTRVVRAHLGQPPSRVRSLLDTAN